jgi:DNA-binding beta-propeller fold protein YncE
LVAELGNDSVGVVDLKEHQVVRTLTGLREPQGIGYVPATDTVYVASAGDGNVSLFQGADLVPAGKIELGDDADNVRVDRKLNRVWVGYGSGALGVIDAVSRKKIASVALKAHPESFQFVESGRRMLVNVPDAHQMAVVNIDSVSQAGTWAAQGLSGNFPMAIDEARQEALIVFRSPPRLGIYGLSQGVLKGAIETCRDADDVFVDARLARVYISCGGGYIDVLSVSASGYVRVAQVATVSGARTALFVPELNRLFLAVGASSNERAAIWVYRPDH